MEVDSKQFERMLDKAEKELKTINREAYDFFKEHTPKASGNAQRNTSLQDNKIKADYAYAKRLDDGWSKQARDGMTQPTIEHLEKKIIPDAVRRMTRGN